jgi:hypothetical protein
MTDFVPAPYLQQSEFPDREAPAGASVSADAASSVAERERLQAEAQARINAGRHPNEIGATP